MLQFNKTWEASKPSFKVTFQIVLFCWSCSNSLSASPSQGMLEKYPGSTTRKLNGGVSRSWPDSHNSIPLTILLTKGSKGSTTRFTKMKNQTKPQTSTSRTWKTVWKSLKELTILAILAKEGQQKFRMPQRPCNWCGRTNKHCCHWQCQHVALLESLRVHTTSYNFWKDLCLTCVPSCNHSRLAHTHTYTRIHDPMQDNSRY